MAVGYVCVCGKEIRVDFESMSTCLPQGYQHDCGKDEEEHYFPGPIIAVSEERDGTWVIVAKRRSREVSN